MNIHVNVSDIRDNVSKIQEGIGSQVQPVSLSRVQSVENRRMLTGSQAQSRSAASIVKGSSILSFASSTLGESPPPRPRVCFGRDELIEKIVGLAGNLTPIALIGAGGIGKTSIALTILHDNRSSNGSARTGGSFVATSSQLRELISSAAFPRSSVRASKIPMI
jgi:hypothetical protein